MRDRVGFIGLGTMGGPMATNLVRAGVPLVVHETNPAATAALAGATVVAASPAEVAAQVGVLFTCLPNDEIVRRVYLGLGGVAPAGQAGLVTCDCSTVAAETTLEIAAALASRGITHLDTPMLGSQPQAGAGEIFFIVGGDRAALDRVKPYLDVMGRLHKWVGPSGTGNRVKLVHNGLAAVTAVAVAEALAVCVQAGVDPYVFFEVVRNGGGMAYGHYFEQRAKRILDGDFSPTFTAELMLKDVRLALSLARAAEVPTPMLEATRNAYEDAIAAGWGDEDFSAVTHVIESRIGRRLSQR
jgi:3-hydroxyisobutyrate dehydrogenase-like beta-hydroxyacid dehydrogenase